MKLKNRLSTILPKKKISQPQLASKLGVDQSAISYWANNSTRIHEKHHKKISEMTKTPENKIFYAEDTEGQRYEIKKIKQ